MPKGPRERTELEDVLRRAFALSTREQLQVYSSLREYLGSAVGVQTPADREIQRRGEALDALEQVARYLRLPPGQAPTAPQFNPAAKKLGLAWNSTSVVETWGRYRNATRAYLGDRLPESPSQRAIRRKTSGRRRNHETYLAGIRLWLGQDPPPATTTHRDYDEFVKHYNGPIAAGKNDRLPLVTAAALRVALNLGWSDILACARGEADYVELVQERTREKVAHEAGPLGLISAGTVGLMLGVGLSEVGYLYERGALPVPVAYVGRLPAWSAEDIESYRAGREVPRRKQGEMQSRILTTSQIATKLGTSSDYVRTALHRKRASVPRPDGKVGGAHYWLRESFEKWSRERKSARSG